MSEQREQSQWRNFLLGVGSLFDICPQREPEPRVRRYLGKDPYLADLEAERSDWEAVGEGMRDAITVLIPVEVQRKVATKSRTEQGMPPPEEVAGYENTLPGAFDRILTMVEQRMKHRQKMEIAELKLEEDEKSGIRSEIRRGQFIGAALAVVLILAGFICVLLDHDVAGAVMVSTTVVALAAVFALGRRGTVRVHHQTNVPASQTESHSERQESEG